MSSKRGKGRERQGEKSKTNKALDAWCSDGTPEELCRKVRAHTTPTGEGRVITRVQGYLLTRLYLVQSTRATHGWDKQTTQAKDRNTKEGKEKEGKKKDVCSAPRAP